jgi:hypothetical protein
MFLDENAFQSEFRRDCSNLARVIRLNATNADECVAALCNCISCKVFKFACLIATVGKAGVHIFALSPDLNFATEVLGEAF